MGSTFQIANSFFSRQLACGPEAQLLPKLRVDVVLVSSWAVRLGLAFGLNASSSEEGEGPRIGPSTSPKNGVPIDTPFPATPFSAIEIHFSRSP